MAGYTGAANAASPQPRDTESAADIMSAAQHHAGLLLQLASDQQVRHHIHCSTLHPCVNASLLLAFSACTIHAALCVAPRTKSRPVCGAYITAP